VFLTHPFGYSLTQFSPKYFSPSPRAIFSTLVIATDQLPPGDVEAVVAGVQARGGVYREGLTRDVTHLLVLGPSGDSITPAETNVLTNSPRKATNMLLPENTPIRRE
jgi:hypothetical protein